MRLAGKGPFSREGAGFSQMALVVKNPSASAGMPRDSGWISGWGRSPREGPGHPLQNSCLENLMDRGAWPVTVHRVTKGRTRLSDLASQGRIRRRSLKVFSWSPGWRTWSPQRNGYICVWGQVPPRKILKLLREVVREPPRVFNLGISPLGSRQETQAKWKMDWEAPGLRRA